MSNAPPPPVPPGGPPLPGDQPPPEPFDAKVKRFIKGLVPSGDNSQEAVDAQMERWLYVLVGVGLTVFVLCGGLYFVFSLFSSKK